MIIKKMCKWNDDRYPMQLSNFNRVKTEAKTLN